MLNSRQERLPGIRKMLGSVDENSRLGSSSGMERWLRRSQRADRATREIFSSHRERFLFHEHPELGEYLVPTAIESGGPAILSKFTLCGGSETRGVARSVYQPLRDGSRGMENNVESAAGNFAWLARVPAVFWPPGEESVSKARETRYMYSGIPAPADATS